MEAARPRKRKRSAVENGSDRRNPTAKKDDDGGEAAAAPPSEAEVEEFYAILRRTRAALKYLNGVRDRRRGEAVVRDGGGGGLNLDLNSVPESENNGACG